MPSPTASDALTQQITACPACAGVKTATVGGPGRAFETVIAGTRFVQPEYLVRACQTCGLWFKSTVLSAAELERYYAQLDGAIFDVDGNFPTDRILRRRLAGLPPGSRVLDFGCSTGRLLKECASRLHCTGIEPNDAAAAIARERGIEIVTLEALTARPLTFDAILLTDVYEHLSAPVGLIETLVQRLSPRGWLAIVTGDADAIAAPQRAAEYWYFRMPGHVVMASERHFRWLADHLRLGNVVIHRCSHYDTPAADRVQQAVRAFAYDRFRDAPAGPAARLLRLIPRLKSAERWENAPAVTYRADHLVAIFSPHASHP